MEDLKAIYALRTTEEAFLDDGKEKFGTIGFKY